ncbi:hypothetical protein DPEC_G00338000 [Dallia pectoralis]|uniref:Uncharacterized protein n=1 Tax=Dallia pectoralis TaxID=75939 RepID=A0ACC2F4T4_DALPE|nr:hypothetical protein DPEC_G00338000 [Dallia pectoralis]
MGTAPSHLLDDGTSKYIRDFAEATLKEFSPHYRRQHPVAFFSHVCDELEQQKEKKTQLLKQKAPPKSGKVLYEEQVLLFDDTRKWKERYMVVRANYSLECHDSVESFIKGAPPRHTLLPTGGVVLTTEEKYMAMVDKCFPVSETSDVNEKFAPPVIGMPGQFPVYLRLPYRSDYYFCFQREAHQASFLSILSDCIRHQNQDFLKKNTVEVQAFLKAIQLYRQEKGFYDSWNMLIGSYVRVMANLVMEDLLPSLEKDILPRLQAKKTEKKRVWFAIVEEAYILVQEHLLVGLSALKEECGIAASQQEVLMRSDMDQIQNSRTYLEKKLQASVSEPAHKFCSESVQPYLASILDELMGPISIGFQEARVLIDNQMDQLCESFQEGVVTEELKQVLADMRRPNLLDCYQRIHSLHDQLHNLQERFGFSNIDSLVHSTQIDLQQLVENAAYTFELMFLKAIEEDHENIGSTMEKSKHMVLKQYDHDSSATRKRIFQEALVGIVLPHIKKNLAPTCKTELQGLEQFIYADYSNFIHVENIYEDILQQCLVQEVSKVVKEAVSLKKHNLLTDSRDLLSRSSRSSLLSTSSPSTPARRLGHPRQVVGGSAADVESDSLEVDTAQVFDYAVEDTVSKPVASETKTTHTLEPTRIAQVNVPKIAKADVNPASTAPQAETKKLDTPISTENVMATKESVIIEGLDVQTAPSAPADGEKPGETDEAPLPSAYPVSDNPVADLDLVAESNSPQKSDSTAAPGGEKRVTPLSSREMQGSTSKSPVRIAAEPNVEVWVGNPVPPNLVSKAAGPGDREANTEAQPDTQGTSPSEPINEVLQTRESSEGVPLDCVKEIRNLVVELLEVKETV